MHRFYIPPSSWKAERLVLDTVESHHAAGVLRLKEGERIAIFDGQGNEATVEILAATNQRVELRKISQSKSAPLACRLTLAQAIPKGKNMELIVEKATELGAAMIAPLISERTVVRCDDEEAAAKKQKWQRVALEAAKQCGQNWLPEVQTPATLKIFFGANPKFDLMLIASLQPDARPLKSILAEFGAAPPQNVLILVGPEGDFTPAEMNLAKAAGCRPISLGPIILRTETAAIYCLSVLAHELFEPPVAKR
ncbi:MAG TPA: 16S rRNA (uracil(1498)-N(3))-methyltransferase [Chthoniobacteraceae bacterium]|nr:16S rRNA (uracil(1498)-N(3))-methyltransferase [Chthoniobacteraceae bacterium]